MPSAHPTDRATPKVETKRDPVDALQHGARSVEDDTDGVLRAEAGAAR